MVFGGFVLLGLAEAWWAKVYFSTSVYYAFLTFAGAAGAWMVAANARLPGFATLAFAHVLIALSWIAFDGFGPDVLVGVGIAVGIAMAFWGEIRARPHLVPYGLLIAGVVQSWWTVENVTSPSVWWPGNLVFTIGAALAVAGTWQMQERAAASG